MITAQIKRKNPKWIEKLRVRMKKNVEHEAAVGFPAGKNNLANPHYDSGASILDVAIANNFGTASIPRRPFMDDAAPKIQKMFKQMLKEAVKRLNDGSLNMQTLLKAAALKSESVIREQIQTGNYAPNSPETIAAKKSSKPLIDSGDMNKYVTSIVRKKS